MNAKKSAPTTAPAAAPTTTAPARTQASSRKPWVKKTPVDVVLEQIGKQEEKVAGMREELAREERELTKLQKAREVLEAT